MHASLVLAAGALQPAGNEAERPVMLWPGTSAAVQAYPNGAAGSSLTTSPQRLRQQWEASSSCGRRIWRLLFTVR